MILHLMLVISLVSWIQFFEHLMYDIRVEDIDESTQITTEINCTKGSGMPGIDKFDELKLMAKLVTMILDKKEFKDTC